MATVSSSTTIHRAASRRGGDSIVAKAQKLLNAHAKQTIVSEDGILGDKTKTALRNFQKEHGLSETGAPDEKTMRALESSSLPRTVAECRDSAVARSYAAQCDAMTRMNQVQGKVSLAANDNGVKPRAEAGITDDTVGFSVAAAEGVDRSGISAEVFSVSVRAGKQTEARGTMVSFEKPVLLGYGGVGMTVMEGNIGAGIHNADGATGVNVSAEATAFEYSASVYNGEGGEFHAGVGIGIGTSASIGLRDSDNDGRIELCGSGEAELGVGISIDACVELPHWLQP